MARPVPRGADADCLRAVLHPAGGPGVGDDALAEAAREGRLARLAADPALARTLPVVVGRLAAAGRLATLHPADRAEAEAVLAWSGQRADAMRAALAPLGEACARERVPVFLCKGAALHGLLYADPSHRPAADVDVFVPGRHVERFDALARVLGFEPDGDSAARVAAFARTGGRRAWLVDLAYAFPRRDGVVEVKAEPVGVGQPPRRLDALAEGGTPSPAYPGLLVPSAETMVVQQAMSLARRPEPDLLAHAELAGVLWTRRRELEPRRLLDLLRGDGLYGILRGVLADTDALFPGVVPPALLARRGRPAGYTPPRIRRGTFAPPRPETAWTRASFWAAQALGNGRPLATLAWLWGRALPPQPLLAALTDGRRGPAAWGTRMRRLVAG